ncbi:hypothetical protein LCGC14_0868170 [marine sediment metagenome]|uniref:Uncharacterized protein n=1 Tax=marine sediment metagenome TaxID=412755 RepID=A0A0F9PAC3_9ZZZZ
MKRSLFIPFIIIIIFILGACATIKKFEAPNTLTSFENNSIRYLMKGYVNSTTFFETVKYAVKNDIPKIVIEIWSPGGLAHETLRIVSIMDEYRDKIIFETRTYSTAWSAGFVVFVSGDIGSRLIAKNASLMWHRVQRYKQGQIIAPGESTKFYTKSLNRYIVSRSAIPIRKLLKKINDIDWFLTAEEAIRYRFADGYIPRIK